MRSLSLAQRLLIFAGLFTLPLTGFAMSVIGRSALAAPRPSIWRVTVYGCDGVRIWSRDVHQVPAWNGSAMVLDGVLVSGGTVIAERMPAP